MAESKLSTEQTLALALNVKRPEGKSDSVRMAYAAKELSSANVERSLRSISEFPNSSNRREVSNTLLLTDVSTGERKALIDPATGTSKESETKDRIDTLSERYLKYIKVGYTGLSEAEKSPFRDQMLQAINSNENLKTALGEALNTAKIKTLDDLLRDESMRGAMADVLGVVYDNEQVQKATDLEKKILEAAVKVKQREGELAQYTSEKEKLAILKTQIDDDARAFSSNFDKESRLQTLAPQAETKNRELESLNTRIDTLNKLKRETGRGFDRGEDLLNAQNRRTDLLQDPDLQQYSQLLGEKKSIEVRMQQVTQRINEIDLALPVKENERNLAIHERDTLTSERKALASIFEDSVDTAVQVAAENMFIQRSLDFISRSDGVMERAEDEVAAAARVKLEKNLKDRWVNKGKHNKVDKNLALSDFKSLMDSGPSGLAAHIIDSMDMTPEERELLKNDPDFLNESGRDMAAKTMSVYLASGGKFTEGELDVLSKTDWADSVYDNAIANDKKASEFLNKMREQGLVTDKASDLEKKFGSKWFKALLLIVLGLVTWQVGGPILMSGLAAAGTHGPDVLNSLGAIINGSKDAAGSVAGGLGNAVAKQAGESLGGLGSAKDAVVTQLGAAKDSAGDAISDAMKAGATDTQPPPQISIDTTGLTDAVGGFKDNALKNAGNIVGAVGNAAQGVTEDRVGDVNETLQEKALNALSGADKSPIPALATAVVGGAAVRFARSRMSKPPAATSE